MMAAVAAAEKPGRHIVVLERQARAGRKLAATGNGRCNLTNLNISPDKYHGDRAFISPAVQKTGAAEILRLFEGLGLLTVSEADGRVYPYTDQASSVVDVLRFAMKSRGVELQSSCEVEAIRRTPHGFTIEYRGGSLRADKVIVACGGAAGARLGGSMSGYRLLEALGHSCTELRPSLVQLKTAGKTTQPLKGVRAEAHVSVLLNGKKTSESSGEVQFTDYGLSGPAIFEISRDALSAPGKIVALDMLSRWETGEISEMLVSRGKSCPELCADAVFAGMLHSRIGALALKLCGIRSDLSLSRLTRGDAEKLAACVKDLEFTVTGSPGFDSAQVTAGGMRTDQFDPLTMESRLCPGLYAAGELLDVDGDCGGFNLHWAWASGLLAGMSV